MHQPPRFELKPGDRLTVIAPHPDDESLGVGGIIWQARQAGVPVSVVFLTNGDGNRVGTIQYSRRALPRPEHYREYGQLRHTEALRALTHLGVSPDQAYFLGLPDQGLQRLLQPRHAEAAYHSKYTKTARAPYATAFAPQLAYTNRAAVLALSHVLQLTKPTVVLVPMLEDTHSDHAAAGELALEASHRAAPDALRFAYPVHFRLFPKPAGMSRSDLPLHPPKHHARRDDWQIVPLSEEARLAKERAVYAHESQLRIPLLDKLMLSLVRSNELVLPLP